MVAAESWNIHISSESRLQRARILNSRANIFMCILVFYIFIYFLFLVLLTVTNFERRRLKEIFDNKSFLRSGRWTAKMNKIQRAPSPSSYRAVADQSLFLDKVLPLTANGRKKNNWTTVPSTPTLI